MKTSCPVAEQEHGQRAAPCSATPTGGARKPSILRRHRRIVARARRHGLRGASPDAGTGLALCGAGGPRCFRAGRCAPWRWSSSGLPPSRGRRAPTSPPIGHLDERVGGCRRGPERRRREQRTAASRRRAAGRRHGARQHRVGRAGRHRRCHSGRNGDGRLSIGVLVGVQPEVERLRIQVLGEAGRHRFSDVGGNVFAHQVGPDTGCRTWAFASASPARCRRTGCSRWAPDCSGATTSARRLSRPSARSCRRTGPTTGWAAGCAGWRFGSVAPRGRGPAPDGRDDGCEVGQ